MSREDQRGEAAREAAPNVLFVWMTAKRVRATDLARRIGCTDQCISMIKNGARKCSPGMKFAIATVSLEIERELGIAEPVGVTVASWNPAPAVVGESQAAS